LFFCPFTFIHTSAYSVVIWPLTPVDEVTSSSGDRKRRLLFLTNKQADMLASTPGSIQRMLDALEAGDTHQSLALALALVVASHQRATHFEC